MALWTLLRLMTNMADLKLLEHDEVLYVTTVENGRELEEEQLRMDLEQLNDLRLWMPGRNFFPQVPPRPLVPRGAP
jgi:hypothetical protein